MRALELALVWQLPKANRKSGGKPPNSIRKQVTEWNLNPKGESWGTPAILADYLRHLISQPFGNLGRVCSREPDTEIICSARKLDAEISAAVAHAL